MLIKEGKNNLGLCNGPTVYVLRASRSEHFTVIVRLVTLHLIIPTKSWTGLYGCVCVCVCQVHRASWHYNQCNVVWSWKADLPDLSWIWNNWLYPMKPCKPHAHTRTHAHMFVHVFWHMDICQNTHTNSTNTHKHRWVRRRKCKINNWEKQHCCCCYYCCLWNRSLGGCQSSSSFTVCGCASACVCVCAGSTSDCRIANPVTPRHTRLPVRPCQTYGLEPKQKKMK